MISQVCIFFWKEVQLTSKCQVWTASGEIYAKEVVDFIFRDIPLKFVWTSDRITVRNFSPYSTEFYGGNDKVKNLKKVKKMGYSLSRTLIVDDTPSTFQNNYGNAIRIRKRLHFGKYTKLIFVCKDTFEGELEDDALLYLITYLQELKHCRNVRKIEKRGWYQRLKTMK